MPTEEDLRRLQETLQEAQEDPDLEQFEMTIKVQRHRRTGQNGVQVSGPIQDMGAAYMMLELARDAIFKFHLAKGQNQPQSSSSLIVPAGMNVPRNR
jgi:hypothetical protein